jgi:hypothetical protein
MMPEFSEFSFGFALTHELVNRWNAQIEVAPVFPTLFQEGQQGGGYDVQLQPGYPLFLQFKMSEYMVRSTAAQWQLFGEPYYRFWMHALRHSEQHDLLLALDVDPNAAYYVAPAIHRTEDLNGAFLAENIIGHSIFIRPRDIGPLPDLDYHAIAFHVGQGLAYRCSEPRKLGVPAMGASFVEELQRLRADHSPIEPTELKFEEFVATLERRVASRAELSFIPRYEGLTDQPMRVRAAYPARTVLGAEFLWVSSSVGVEPQ